MDSIARKFEGMNYNFITIKEKGEKKEKEKEGAKLRVVLLLGLVESGRNE